MEFSHITKELQVNIVDLACRLEQTGEISTNTCATKIMALGLVNKIFYGACQIYLDKLKLVGKYKAFKSESIEAIKSRFTMFDSYCQKLNLKFEGDYTSQPQLYDALLSGFDLPAGHSFKEYTPEIEEDIKKIVALIPESVNYNLGDMGCTKFVNSLFVACANRNVPIYIVELLIKNKADLNSMVLCQEKPTKIFDILLELTLPERFEQIKILFEKYGYKKEL